MSADGIEECGDCGAHLSCNCTAAPDIGAFSSAELVDMMQDDQSTKGGAAAALRAIWRSAFTAALAGGASVVAAELAADESILTMERRGMLPAGVRGL